MYSVQILFDDLEEAIEWLKNVVDLELAKEGFIVDNVEGGEVIHVGN